MKFRKGIYRIARQRLARGDIGWFLRRAVQYRRIRRALRRPGGLTSAGPIIAHLFATTRCDSRCVMCDIPRRSADYEFTTADFRSLLEQFVALGVAGVALTGGEVTLRPDIHELLDLSRRAGLDTILVTNGLTLERHIDRIVELGVGTVNVSLDGADPATHDAIRGVPGAFAQTTANIRRLVERARTARAPTEVAISTVLQTANASRAQLDALLHFLADLGIGRVIFCPVHGFDCGRQEAEVGKIVPGHDLGRFLREHPLRSIIDNSDWYLSRLTGVIASRRPPDGCVAGYTTLFVDWELNLYPCKAFLEVRKPLASLRRDARSLAEIWRGEEFNSFRRFCPSCRQCFLTVNREFDGVFR
jgi:MoaA/NifB/PqqE/SkfB family radical SAM enzyme